MDADPDAVTEPLPVIPVETLDPWLRPDVALANAEPF